MHKNLDKFYCSKICFDTNISFMQTTPHTENFGGNGPQKHWNFLLESRKQWDLLLLEKKKDVKKWITIGMVFQRVHFLKEKDSMNDFDFQIRYKDRISAYFH